MKELIKRYALFSSILVFIDFAIKQVLINTIGFVTQCNSKGRIHIHLKYNDAGNFIAWRFGVTYQRTAFLAIAAVCTILLAVLIIWRHEEFEENNFSFAGIIFGTAATIGRLVERTINLYTLDYLAFKFGVCDTIDIYLLLALICIVMGIIKEERRKIKRLVK